jgi:hypothetical protein
MAGNSAELAPECQGVVYVTLAPQSANPLLKATDFSRKGQEISLWLILRVIAGHSSTSRLAKAMLGVRSFMSDRSLLTAHGVDKLANTFRCGCQLRQRRLS